MKITRNGSQPSIAGPVAWFSGVVRIDPLLLKANAPSRLTAARTAWHTHPLGQTLIITAGYGWAQRAGGPIEAIQPGDVVWFAPGEKHWHGASPDTALTHIAMQEELDGSAVEWLEQVSEDSYATSIR